MPTMRGAFALAALAALAPSARAFLILDDFTEGGFTHVLDLERSFTFEEPGLDTAHSAWGFRGTFTRINSNPNNTTLEVHVGGGEQAFRSPVPIMWDHDLRLGNRDSEVDLSGQTQINVDYTTQWPPNTNADSWSLLVADAHGGTASNDGWLLRPEGIYFEVADFSRPVDWSRITLLEFSQYFDSLPNPLTYSVTMVSAVPEPSLMAMLGGSLLALRCRRARSGRS